MFSDLQNDCEEIFNLPTVIFAILDGAGVFSRVNIGQEHILGWKAEELIGKPALDFVYLEDLSFAAEKLQTLFLGGPLLKDIRVRMLASTGRYLWVSWSGYMKGNQIYCIGIDIHQRVEEEEKKKSVEIRFRAFFEQSAFPMVIYSLEGIPLEVNHAWEKLFDTTWEQVQGYNVLHDPQLEALGLLSYLHRAYAGESVEVPAFKYDPGLINQPGRVRYLEAWLSPVKDEQGNTRELAMILKDVTDNQESAARLKVVSERLTLALRTAHIGIWEWIPGTPIVKWDQTTEAFFGFEPGTFPGTREAYVERLHPEEREKMAAAVQRALTLGEAYSLPHRVLWPDGTIRWIQGSGQAIFDSNGKPVRMIGTVIDIHERKQSYEMQELLTAISTILAQSLDFDKILKAFTRGILPAFCDLCIIDLLISPRVVGKTTVVAHRDSLKEADLLDIHSHVDENSSETFLIDLQVGETRIFEDLDEFYSLVCKKQGETYTHILKSLGLKSVLVTRLKGRGGPIGTIAYITTEESKRRFNERHISFAEELTYRLSMALDNAMLFRKTQEAIRSRDEFFSIASHELKTPLTPLKMQLESLQRYLTKHNALPSQDRIQNLIDSSQRQICRLTTLIDDLLDVSRIGSEQLSLNKERIDLSQVIHDIVERYLAHALSANCVLSLHVTRSVWGQWDRLRIEQVIVNLLTNAIKYAPGKPIELFIDAHGDKARFEVKDQGKGIPFEQQARIFDRFERVDHSEVIAGLGLGLFISKQIVEAHQGKIWVECGPDGGAIFIVELPIHEGE